MDFSGWVFFASFGRIDVAPFISATLFRYSSDGCEERNSWTWFELFQFFFSLLLLLLLTFLTGISIELLLHKIQYKWCRLIRFWWITDTTVGRHNLRHSKFIRLNWVRLCPCGVSASFAQSKNTTFTRGLDMPMICDACMQSCHSYAIIHNAHNWNVNFEFLLLYSKYTFQRFSCPSLSLCLFLSVSLRVSLSS